jgi:hypothetical protein
MKSAALINQLCENDDVVARIKRIFPNQRVEAGSTYTLPTGEPCAIDRIWVTFVNDGRISCHMRVWPVSDMVYIMLVNHRGEVCTQLYLSTDKSGIFHIIPNTDEAIKKVGDEVATQIAAERLEKDDTAGEIRATLGEARESRLGISWPAVRKRIKETVDALASNKTEDEIEVDVDLPLINALGINVRLGSYTLTSEHQAGNVRYVFANVFTPDRNLTTSSWRVIHAADFSRLVADRARVVLACLDKDAEKRSELADEIKSLS